MRDLLDDAGALYYERPPHLPAQKLFYEVTRESSVISFFERSDSKISLAIG